MKHLLKLLTVIPLIVPSLAFGTEYLEEVESVVYQTNGTAQEIATKAKTCIVQIVRNDEVSMTDNVSDTRIGSVELRKNPMTVIPGGPVLVDVNIESGMVAANNRVDFGTTLLGVPIKENVKSLITVLTKEGRFKIRHTNIEAIQKNTGAVQNTGYYRVGKGWGSSWRAAETALKSVSEKLANCIQSDPKKEDW